MSRYAPRRSGETATAVLDNSRKHLIVDQLTGYDADTKPGVRARPAEGCLAHARRKIVEQREHPQTKEALDIISAIYFVEREAKPAKITGTPPRALRAAHDALPNALRAVALLGSHRETLEPRSAMHRAIRYLLK